MPPISRHSPTSRPTRPSAPPTTPEQQLAELKKIREPYRRKLLEIPGVKGTGLSTDGREVFLSIIVDSTPNIDRVRAALPAALLKKLKAAGFGVRLEAIDAVGRPREALPIKGISAPKTAPAGKPFDVTVAASVLTTQEISGSTARLQGKRILIEVTGKWTRDAFGVARLAPVKVRVPALAPGKYTLVAGKPPVQTNITIVAPSR